MLNILLHNAYSLNNANLKIKSKLKNEKGGDNMADLVKRDPFRSLFSFPRWMEEMDFTTTSQRGLRIYETDKDIKVEAVIAGVPEKNIDVDIEDGVITIKGEKKEEKDEKDQYQSTSYSYYYTAALSGGQWDKAEAEVENGVVIVTIPKTEAARPQKIKVKSRNS